jgi:hypothetical protein
MLNLQCSNEEKIPVAVAPVTAAGNPASVEVGTLKVTVTSGDGTANVLSDMTFELVSGPGAGDTVYHVEADADLGPGLATIGDDVMLTVRLAEATALGLTAASPQPK